MMMCVSTHDAHFISVLNVWAGLPRRLNHTQTHTSIFASYLMYNEKWEQFLINFWRCQILMRNATNEMRKMLLTFLKMMLKTLNSIESSKAKATNRQQAGKRKTEKKKKKQQNYKHNQWNRNEQRCQMTTQLCLFIEEKCAPSPF